MQIRTEFPRPTRTIANTFIPLADGTKLAARIWLPEDAEADPVPAILEYIPYRKDDGTAARDALMHPWWAGHGYANVRVDQRGSATPTGSSSTSTRAGARRRARGHRLARRAALVHRQGRHHRQVVGRVQRAADRRAPPARARGVISVASTDDRYADDIHYIGGALHGFQMQSWASTMLAYNARPPDPLFVGERWRELWLERLEQTPPFLARVGLAPAPRRVLEARLGVRGLRRHRRCRCTRSAAGRTATRTHLPLHGGLRRGRARACAGRGATLYPQSGLPGPRSASCRTPLRFWDRTLKGIDNGMLDEPPLHAWIQEWVEPASASHVERPGRWVAESAWPSPDLREPTTLHLRPTARLAEDAGAGRRAPVRGLQHTGLGCRRLDGRRRLRGRSDRPTSAPRTGARSASPRRRCPSALEMLGFPEARLDAGLGQAARARRRARLRRLADGRRRCSSAAAS